MSSILFITSSPRDESISTQIASEFVGKLQAQKPGTTVVRRDLGFDPLPHLDTVTTSAIRKPAEARTPEEAVVADPFLVHAGQRSDPPVVPATLKVVK